MSDHEVEQLANLFISDNDKEIGYTESQLMYLTDINNGAYSTGEVRFDTSTLKEQFILYSEGFLVIPITVTASGGTAFQNTTPVAFRQSVLSLITGMTISMGNGDVIVNEISGLNFINHLRLLTSQHDDEFRTLAPLLQFYKEEKNSVNNAEFTVTTNTLTGRDATYNSGFANRINSFVASSTWNGTINGYTTDVVIPLKYVHPFFKELNFPVLNMRFMFTFQTAAYINSPFNPILSTIAAKTVIGGTTIGAARLYYKKVSLPADLQLKYAKKLEAGMTKRIDFLSLDAPIIVPNNADTTISKQISTNTVKPKRIWVLLFPGGSLTSGVAPLVVNGQLRAATLQVNGMQYNNTAINFPYEFWVNLLDQMTNENGQGGLISYADFLTNYRIHVWDVSKRKDAILSLTEAVSLTLNASRNEATPSASDIMFLVERENRIALHFSSSDVRVLVGPNV